MTDLWKENERLRIRITDQLTEIEKLRSQLEASVAMNRLQADQDERVRELEKLATERYERIKELEVELSDWKVANRKEAEHDKKFYVTDSELSYRPLTDADRSELLSELNRSEADLLAEVKRVVEFQCSIREKISFIVYDIVLPITVSVSVLLAVIIAIKLAWK
jgi:predicted RNase H-like nuclease (RuvC/YqgF family)